MSDLRPPPPPTPAFAPPAPPSSSRSRNTAPPPPPGKRRHVGWVWEIEDDKPRETMDTKLREAQRLAEAMAKREVMDARSSNRAGISGDQAIAVPSNALRRRRPIGPTTARRSERAQMRMLMTASYKEDGDLDDDRRKPSASGSGSARTRATRATSTTSSLAGASTNPLTPSLAHPPPPQQQQPSSSHHPSPPIPLAKQEQANQPIVGSKRKRVEDSSSDLSSVPSDEENAGESAEEKDEEGEGEEVEDDEDEDERMYVDEDLADGLSRQSPPSTSTSSSKGPYPTPDPVRGKLPTASTSIKQETLSSGYPTDGRLQTFGPPVLITEDAGSRRLQIARARARKRATAIGGDIQGRVHWSSVDAPASTGASGPDAQGSVTTSQKPIQQPLGMQLGPTALAAERTQVEPQPPQSVDGHYTDPDNKKHWKTSSTAAKEQWDAIRKANPALKTKSGPSRPFGTKLVVKTKIPVAIAADSVPAPPVVHRVSGTTATATVKANMTTTAFKIKDKPLSLEPKPLLATGALEPVVPLTPMQSSFPLGLIQDTSVATFPAMPPRPIGRSSPSDARSKAPGTVPALSSEDISKSERPTMQRTIAPAAKAILATDERSSSSAHSRTFSLTSHSGGGLQSDPAAAPTTGSTERHSPARRSATHEIVLESSSRPNAVQSSRPSGITEAEWVQMGPGDRGTLGKINLSKLLKHAKTKTPVEEDIANGRDAQDGPEQTASASGASGTSHPRKRSRSITEGGGPLAAGSAQLPKPTDRRGGPKSIAKEAKKYFQSAEDREIGLAALKALPKKQPVQIAVLTAALGRSASPQNIAEIRAVPEPEGSRYRRPSHLLDVPPMDKAPSITEFGSASPPLEMGSEGDSADQRGHFYCSKAGCRKIYQQRAGLKYHLAKGRCEMQGRGDFSYPCLTPDCNKTYNSSIALTTHLERDSCTLRHATRTQSSMSPPSTNAGLNAPEDRTREQVASVDMPPRPLPATGWPPLTPGDERWGNYPSERPGRRDRSLSLSLVQVSPPGSARPSPPPHPYPSPWSHSGHSQSHPYYLDQGYVPQAAPESGSYLLSRFIEPEPAPMAPPPVWYPPPYGYYGYPPHGFPQPMPPPPPPHWGW